MKKIKLISKDAGAVVYGIGEHKAFGAKLVKEVEWPARVRSAAFQFKAVAPSEGYLNPAVPKGCAVRVVYYARPGQIKVPAAGKTVVGLELGPARSLAEFKKLTTDSIYREYINPYRRHISRSFVKVSDAFIARELKKCRNVVLRLDGRAVGIASTVRGKVKGKPGTHVAWVWIDSGLPKAERDGARHLVARWLRGHSTPVLATAEHGVSKKTQKFFTALGFKAERYVVDRLAE